MMKTMEERYTEVLSFKIPKETFNPTLFDIQNAKYAENIISNWYAFFLDSSIEHGLEDLFLQSLIEIINKKTDDFVEMDSCEVIREHPTGNGYIDLVVYDGDEQMPSNVIIIENKINAVLNNDLEDYYNCIMTENAKIGIVLSLNELFISHPYFINITHLEYIRKIEQNLTSYWLQGNGKYLLYLKDFICNIHTISKKNNMTKELEFYLKNAEKINQLLALQTQAENYITDALGNAILQVQYLEWFRKNQGSITLNVPDTNLRFYIYYSDIFEKGSYEIKLWASGKEYIERMNGLVQDTVKQTEGSVTIEWENAGKGWLKIASRTYEGLTKQDIESIGQVITEAIGKDFFILISVIKNKLEDMSLLSSLSY